MSQFAVLAEIKRLIRLRWKRLRSRLSSSVRSQQKRSHWLQRSPGRVLTKVASLVIAIGLSLAVVTHSVPALLEQPSSAQSFVGDRLDGARQAPTIAQKPAPDFPLQSHPLPPTLARWQNSTGDYFDQIEVLPVGYLIWSHVPVTVHIQPPTAAELANPFTAQRARVWVNAVSQAVQEWNRYLPLSLVDQVDGADIAVSRSPPTLQLEASPAPQAPRPTLQLGRVRSAVTRYKVYVKSSSKEGLSKDAAPKPMLAHRCTIQLRPDQAPQYLQAAARHELGHALGIWGHSRSQTDVMYFSQVRQPPPLSPRDLNTLKRVYEQPTRLGWAWTE